jgi:UDPglucose 6-dehydrogenase
MRIAVVGSGYVGLVAGACFAELGHQVILVDNVAEKVAALERGETPIHEEYLPELLARHRGERISFTTDLQTAVEKSQAIFIAVGTPPKEDGDADLSYVESVARDIAKSIGNEYKIVVDKSTVPVYTSEWVRRIMILNGADPELFDVTSNPEFLREGTAVVDFLYPDRIVVGADSDGAFALLREAYAPLTNGEYYTRATAIPGPDNVALPPRIIETSAKSAEMIKHASNAFLAMKISFVNAVANICEAVGADVEQVCDGMGTDARIGRRFLYPGIGYGGSCFPKDVSAFRVVARENGYDFRLLEEVMRINEHQRERFLRKVRKALWTLKGKRLAVLGLAFKGGTDDIRESPALQVVKSLVKEGADVTCYDPAAIERSRFELGDCNGRVHYANTAQSAMENADALLILTDWDEFAQLDLQQVATALRYPIVLDGRNLFKPADAAAAGLVYYSIGRPDVAPARQKAAVPAVLKAA